MDGELAHWQEQFDALDSSNGTRPKPESKPKSEPADAKSRRPH
jgi:hypothetical protein